MLCASPLFASANDRTTSDTSSNSGSHSDPAPAPAERSDPAPAPVERSDSAPAPVDRSAPAPVERAVPAPVTNAPSDRAETRPVPQPPGRGPVQPLPPYQRQVPTQPGGGSGHKPKPNPHQYSNPSQSNDDETDTTEANSNASRVAPGAIGAQLLHAYGLRQTLCGAPNLVEIVRPGASEICAFPNNVIGPGRYQVDPATLMLYPAQPSD